MSSLDQKIVMAEEKAQEMGECGRKREQRAYLNKIAEYRNKRQQQRYARVNKTSTAGPSEFKRPNATRILEENSPTGTSTKHNKISETPNHLTTLKVNSRMG